MSSRFHKIQCKFLHVYDTAQSLQRTIIWHKRRITLNIVIVYFKNRLFHVKNERLHLYIVLYLFLEKHLGLNKRTLAGIVVSCDTMKDLLAGGDKRSVQSLQGLILFQPEHIELLYLEFLLTLTGVYKSQRTTLMSDITFC